MAKNMQNTGFRKLDVDAFNEDQYHEDDDADTPSLGPDETEVNGLLQSNRLQEALRAALRNPPLKTKNQALKSKAASLMLRVLTSFRVSDMESVVGGLSRDELDLLMKYIYKCFEAPDNSGAAALLAWHERVYAQAGHGVIVRVFTDRRRL